MRFHPCWMYRYRAFLGSADNSYGSRIWLVHHREWCWYHLGQVMVAARNILPRIASACLHCTNCPIIFESGCISEVQNLQLGNASLSHLRSIYSDFACFRCFSSEQEVCTACVRLLGVGSIWNNFFPDRVARALALDCNRTSDGIMNEAL